MTRTWHSGVLICHNNNKGFIHQKIKKIQGSVRNLMSSKIKKVKVIIKVLVYHIANSYLKTKRLIRNSEKHSVNLGFKTSFFPKIVTRRFKTRHNRYKWMFFDIENFSERFTVLPLCVCVVRGC